MRHEEFGKVAADEAQFALDSLSAAAGEVDVPHCAFAEEVGLSWRFGLVDEDFVEAFVPIAGAEDAFAPELVAVVGHFVGNVLVESVILVVLLSIGFL